MEELFSAKYGMFKYNEDVQMYWFNGQTFETNLNFELVGTLLGIAMYNSCNIEVPLAPVIYKLILGGKANLEDMTFWQPELGRNLQYILDYEDHEKCPLEDIICRTFAVDVETFGTVN